MRSYDTWMAGPMQIDRIRGAIQKRFTAFAKKDRRIAMTTDLGYI